MKIADAFVLVSKDDSPLKRGLASTRKDIEGWTGSVSGIIKNALGFSLGQAFTAGVKSILGSLRQLGTGLISGNDQFEQYQTRFKVLLGSMDAAKERIADLAHFGATTPFDLPGVVEADTILQAFGFHAEETKNKFGFAGDEIRRIAGDVASGAGASFQEIALNLGKFSAGATGEAMMRFQEMGIVTRETLRGMGVEFSQSGALLSPLPQAMTAILTVMQEKYGGMMDAQSATFSGMRSNLEDWVGNAQRVLGLPTFEILRGQLADLLEFLNSGTMSSALMGLRDLIAALSAGVVGSVRGMAGAVNGAFTGMFGDTDQAMQGFANNAFGWGENIAISFAEGIYAAAAAVIQALMYLGSLISYWLVPGSPPKLLPNLTAWGTGAAQAWLEGWTQADFSVFRDLSGMLERAINSLGLEDSAAVGALINVRQWLRQAIEEINEMGDVSEATLEKITSSAGNLAGPIGDYVRDLAEVARRTKAVEEAQEKVNRITERYDAILSPLQERLQGIRDQESSFRNEQERARLQEILASATAGEREKEQARLALERLALEEEITGVEREKNKELSEAEKQLKDARDGLKLAQDKLNLSKDYIDQLTEENELLDRQRRLLEDIGGGGGAGAGPGGPKGGGMGIPGFDLPEPPGGGGLFDRINEWLNRGPAGDDIGKRLENLMGRIQDMFKPLERDAERMGEVWEKAGRAFSRFFVDPIRDFLATDNGQLLIDFLKNLAVVVGSKILLGGLASLAIGLAAVASPVLLLAIAVAALMAVWNDPRIQAGMAAWAGVADNIDTIFGFVIENIGLLTEEQQASLNNTEGWFAQLGIISLLGLWAILDIFYQAKLRLEQTISELAAKVVLYIAQMALDIIAKTEELKGRWSETWGGIADNARAVWDALRAYAGNWIGELKKDVLQKVEELRSGWSEKWLEIKKKALELLTGLVNALPTPLANLARTIIQAVSDLIGDLQGKVSEWQGVGRSFIQGIIDGASSLAGSLVAAVVQMVLDAVSGAANAILAKSPSKLTHDKLGVAMGEGVIGGWEDSMKTAQQQMARTLVAAIPSPAAALAGINGDTHETYNFYGQRDVGMTMQDIRQANERRRFNGRMNRR